MLNRRRILIAEDEPFTAYALARAIEDADGEVVGPVASVQEGMALLAREDVDGAILDVLLIDRDIAPIAETLLERGRVVVFHTASAVPAEIISRFGEVVVCLKPAESESVVRRLATLMGMRDTSEP